ncbi:MAG: cupin domain-containing protein [gamma proteobacterium symbiont of Bathyaustriella thionipta]|nr:cupin domain-containing protein [gamma proteobacterium symbiont of Bathyaustriella thionipta]
MHTLNFPSGISTTQFLAQYWQRQPLYMPAAISGCSSPLSANELAGLACDERIESRIVLQQDGQAPWQVLFGPFDEQQFADLPASHWSLLVQDVDKFVPAAADLLNYFRFIPDWRIDDIMVSYAPRQGSVGPHMDEYDVFLLQVQGQRRWRIENQPRSTDEYIEGLDLRILPSFNADQEWLMSAGDILYLPPGIPHWGIAENDCMTCSIGIRAPQWREMFEHYCQDLAEQCRHTEYYRDTALQPQTCSAEILPQALQQIEQKIGQMAASSALQRMQWFGRYISSEKPGLEITPPQHKLDVATFRQDFEKYSILQRHLGSRIFFSSLENHQISIFANGQAFTLAASERGFVEALSHQRPLHFGFIDTWLENDANLELLNHLFNLGHFYFEST